MSNYLYNFNALSSVNEQVESVAKNANIDIKIINEERTNSIISNVAVKYFKCRDNFPSWERICRAASKKHIKCKVISDEKVWLGIENLDLKDVILFFHYDDSKVSYLFKNGKDVVDTLIKCYDFEFYLTNNNLEYLIAYSHHKKLYICKV